MSDKVIAIKIDVKGTSEQNKKLSQLEKSIKELTIERNRLNKAQKDGVISLDQYSRSVSKVNTKLKGARSELNQTRNSVLGLTGFTDKLGSKFKQLGTSISGAFVGLFAVQELFSLIKSGIKTIEDFELQMAKVAAITKATSVEVDLLTESAKDLGRVSQFTATEVGKLQEEFAKLGFSTAEILAASEATLQLATATGADLAQAAEVAASTLNTFDLKASETQKIVDLMAESFSAVPLDINRFQESMKLVAPTAKSLKISVQETTAQLGLLAKSGITGSIAGTQLNRVFVELNKKGISLEKAMEMVASSTNKLGTATELVGDRGAKALQIFASQSDQLQDLTVAFSDSEGEAKRMADTVGNTAAGAAKKLDSAWEAMILTIGKGSEGPLAKAKIAVADFFNFVTSASNEANQLIEVGGIFEDSETRAAGLKVVNDEQKFLKKNVSDLNKLRERGLKLTAEIRKEQEIRSKAIKEDNEEQEELSNVLILARFNALKAISSQTEELKKRNKETKAATEFAEAEAKAESKKAKAVELTTEQKKEQQKANEKIAAEDIKLSEQTRKLKQDQLILEIEDKREAEFQKLTIAEENAIREVEATVASKEKQNEAIAAIQDKFEAQRRQKEKDDEKEAKDKAKAKEDKELLREQQIAFAEDTAQLLSDITSSRVERQKDLELASLNAQLEQGLINQQQFDEQREKIEIKAFNQQKKIDVATALANGAIAITKTIAQLGGLGAITPFGAASLALVGAQTAAQVGIISSQKFEDGGLLSGASHANGGIPFTVGGVGGFEAEGGEAIINKRSTSMFAPLLSAINQAGGGVSFAKPNIGSTMFANGGIATQSSIDSTGLRNEITNAVKDSIGAIQVVNVATDTVGEAVRVNNVQQEATFG